MKIGHWIDGTQIFEKPRCVCFMLCWVMCSTVNFKSDDVRICQVFLFSSVCVHGVNNPTLFFLLAFNVVDPFERADRVDFMIMVVTGRFVEVRRFVVSR